LAGFILCPPEAPLKNHRRCKSTIMQHTNTMNRTVVEATAIPPALGPRPGKIEYTDVTRGATQFCLRSEVFLETRVLDEFMEVDRTLGHNAAGVIFSVLQFHLAEGRVTGADHITLCLAQKTGGRVVEVDLLALQRHLGTGERIYLRFVAARPLDVPETEDADEAR